MSGIQSALTEFIGVLVSGLVDMAEGIANGIVAMAQALFLNVDSTTHAVTGLSVFGGIVAIFAGLSLAVGITTKVYTWVTSLGN